MRTTLIRRLTAGLVAALLCFPLSAALSGEIEAELLIYRVQPTEEAAYLNRLLVTPAFLRLDRGAEDSGYILYDRKQQVIYSINHGDHTILVIDPPALAAEVEAGAPEIALQAVETPVEAPEVGGVTPRQWSLVVAGQSCREAFILPGLMPAAVAAYGEYLTILSHQQAQALTAIPAEFQDPCDNAVHVFAAAALLRKGLPLSVWDSRGYRESLIDFRASFPAPDADFTLPADYARVPMRAMF